VPPDTATLVAHRLGLMARVVVASPAYLRRRNEPREPQALASHDAIVQLRTGGAGVSAWHLQSEHGEKTQVSVAGPLRSTALHVVREGALAGAGIALVPRFVVAHDLEEGRLRELVLGGWSPTPRVIHALVRIESNGRARIRAVVDHVRAYVGARVGAFVPR
jgi:DNA-binding transcriptional LysR family regulator